MPDKRNEILSFTLIVHVYYPGSWKRISERIGHLLPRAHHIIITCGSADAAAEIDEPRAILFRTTNLGKDIGGKLFSLNYYLKWLTRSALIFFIHDKVSPQTLNAEYWFERLTSIYSPGTIERIMQRFIADPELGLVGASDFIQEERPGKNPGTNAEQIAALLAGLQLEPADYRFVAGTIFIARSEVYEKVFLYYNLLDARGRLEPGNVLDLDSGSRTHAWERVLAYAASAKGFKLEGMK